MKTEKRIYKAEDGYQLRAVKNDDGKRFIEGFAIVFDHESRLIWDWMEGEFIEVIRKGAADDVLKSEDLDVLATFNHSNDKILGRFTAGRDSNTLELILSDENLKYRIDVPNTPTGDEVFGLVERGDLNESSFVFQVAQDDQEWDFNGDIAKRFVNRISGLFDVSVVWKGAYSQTDVEVSARYFKEAEKEHKKPTEKEIEAEEIRATNDMDDMNIKLLKIKRKK